MLQANTNKQKLLRQTHIGHKVVTLKLQIIN